MNQSFLSMLKLALEWKQLNGIVINSFGKYIQMSRKMIEFLLSGYDYYEQEKRQMRNRILNLCIWYNVNV